MKQLELFERPKDLTGEDAWKLAKAVSIGDYTYDEAKEMVLSVAELDKDLEYIDSIVHSYRY